MKKKTNLTLSKLTYLLPRRLIYPQTLIYIYIYIYNYINTRTITIQTLELLIGSFCIYYIYMIYVYLLTKNNDTNQKHARLTNSNRYNIIHWWIFLTFFFSYKPYP